MKHVLLVNVLILLLITLLSSCQKDLKHSQDSSDLLLPDKIVQAAKQLTYAGPEVKLGNGTVHTFLVTTPSGQPQELGIELTAGALQGLPESEGEYSFQLALPEKAKSLTPFNHVEVDWNPFGHPPPGIYDAPHFDLHFYKISLEDQLAIPPYTEETASMFDNYPPAGYIPDGYAPGEGGVPQMGKHWVDLMAPEFNGGTFTKTFIYGSYNGAVTFYEPMVTKAFLESTSYTATDIRQPQYYSPVNTYYPTKYRIYRDAALSGNYFISLSSFEWKK